MRLRGVSRKFRIVHERNLTLKETVLRRRRVTATEMWALREVDLDVAPGEAVGVVGQNGSGKSTLLKVVAGIIPPQAGTVEAGGRVASMLELGAGFHPDFTGRENVYMNASIYGLSDREVDGRFDQIVEFSELSDFIEMPVKTYSSGMYMRLAFAIAIHVDADVLLLDEVMAVGDEAFQRKCFARMFEYRRRGGTMLFVSHDPNTVERICDRAVFLEDGRVVQDARPSEVLVSYHRRLAGVGSAVTASSRRDEEPQHLGPVDQDADDDVPEADDRQWGDMRALIRSARLVGPDGITDSFMSGQHFVVELAVQAREAIRNPMFGVSIHSIDGTLCYGTHTGMDAQVFHPLAAGERALVRFTVDALHLHEGRFLVTVGLSDDGEVCHHLERWIEFNVFQHNTGVGLVDMSGAWSFTTQGETAAASGVAVEASAD